MILNLINKKYRITYFSSLIILMLAAGSCETPFTPKLNAEDSKPLLVVEGQITDQEGPFTVKITTSLPVNVIGTPPPQLNADVHIIDDQGHTFSLFLTGNGNYETAEKKLKGIPGNKYTLNITTLTDGRQYTSMPVLMQEVPDIDSLYFEVVSHSLVTQGKAQEANWLNILLDAHDTTGNTKYWRWEYVETFLGLRKL